MYAAPLIMKELGMNKIGEVKEYIHSLMVNSEAKFMMLIQNYYNEMDKYGKINEFKLSLLNIVRTAVNEEAHLFSGKLNQLSYLSYNR